jgi:two-component system NtrC family sensor kinase
MNIPQSQSFEEHANRRILVVDDDPSIQEDYRKILAPAHDTPEIDRLEAELFGASNAACPAVRFELDQAMQAEEALRKAAEACLQQRRYAMAYIDVRMPPGIDGIQATRQLWAIDPHVQVVICSAYSDHTWEQIVRELGQSDQFLVLRKPFEAIEVRQLALAMTTKWNASRDARRLMRELEDRCEALTRQLQLAGDRGVPLVTALPA